MRTSKWRALIRRLRERFPVQGTVRVIRRPVKRGCGLATFNGRDYRVRINSRQSALGQIDTLLHEWAHVRAIEEAYGHRGRWATLHGEIYDAWTRDFELPDAPEPQGAG